MPKVSGSSPLALRLATTRASARADTIGSTMLSVRRGGDRGIERGRDRDGVAVHAQPEGGDDRHLDVAEPEARRDRDRRDQVRGIEQADIELVAHVRPGDLAHQLDVETLGGGEALVDRDDQRGRVGERNEADPQTVAVLLISTAPRP